MKQHIYRVWDKKNKLMIVLDDLWIDSEYSSIAFQSKFEKYNGIDALPFNRLEDIELMEYIGRKDKNNKKIFEGDIVNWGRHIGNKEPLNEIVEWYQKDGFCGFRLKSTDDDTYNIQNPFNLNIKIIGNIYENPELIKKGDDI